ncbi:MAG: DUF2892 domain-containing protein [Candidatus Moranbacteria bacterium]|nr:DUF2892 domain-containing protein [bacterium]MDP1833968.1 DUF2892 domain-containing protein [Candidatus Moranbacteria bacterium]
MVKNESGVDRIIRAVAGIALVAAAFLLEANGFTVALYVVGIVLIVTAMTGFCLLYKIFGIDTNRKK